MKIAAFSPANYNYDERLSTLMYADWAKSIKNKPKINEDPKSACETVWEWDSGIKSDVDADAVIGSDISINDKRDGEDAN